MSSAEHRRGAGRPPVELRLWAADALRRAGRSRGIEDRDGLAGFHALRRQRVAGRRKRLDRKPAPVRSGAVHEPDPLELGGSASTISRCGRRSRWIASTRGPEFTSTCSSWGPRVAVFNGTRLAPSQAPRAMRRELHPVLAHDRDAVAASHAGGREASRRPRRRVAHLRVGAHGVADAAGTACRRSAAAWRSSNAGSVCSRARQTASGDPSRAAAPLASGPPALRMV